MIEFKRDGAGRMLLHRGDIADVLETGNGRVQVTLRDGRTFTCMATWKDTVAAFNPDKEA